jgi:hypothetical protein
MEIANEAEFYTPSLNDTGVYIDKIPVPTTFSNGVRCPCGRNTVHRTRSAFSAHIKTKSHAKWLSDLNANRNNHLIECERLRETVHTQRIIIAKMEKDLEAKLLKINYLKEIIEQSTSQINNKMYKLD